MDAHPPSHLVQALAQARMRGNLKTQGMLARELGLSWLEKSAEQAFLSFDRGHSLAQAEHYLQMSADCFFKLGDIVQSHLAIGLIGAAEYDGGDFRIGITRMRHAIDVIKHQEDTVTELDLTIQFLMRARPESWLALKRAFWLTRKDGPQANRRWEVVTAAIGGDIYRWMKGRQQRAHAA